MFQFDYKYRHDGPMTLTGAGGKSADRYVHDEVIFMKFMSDDGTLPDVTFKMLHEYGPVHVHKLMA